MTSYDSSPTKFFNIPELVNLVSTFSRRSDLVRLSQVSQRTFKILTPAIWRSVQGAEHLLGLIKSATLRRNGPERYAKLEEIIIKDQPDTGCDLFERFDIYAPHVRILKVYDEHSSGYTVSGWPVLTTRAQHRPLLPNLKALYISRRDFLLQGPDVDHEIMWITTFTTSLTNEVHTHPDNFSTLFSTTSFFIEAIATHCPNIERLTFCSHDDPYSRAMLNQARVPSRPWFQHLSFLRHLRYLSVTEGWLYHPCLLVLGQLPQLESLEIGRGDLNGFEVAHNRIHTPILPPGSFPMLSRLSIKRLHPHVGQEILNIWEMLGRVSYLYLDLALKHVEPHEWDDHWVTHDFFPLLENTPFLNHLEIECYSMEMEERVIGVPTVLDVMSQLPLETVHLGAFQLGGDILELDLGAIWPNVTRLSMRYQCISLQELAHLIAMPKLEYLEAFLRLSTVHTLEGLVVSELTSERTFILDPGWSLRISPGLFDLLDHHSRLLASLWPNLRLDPSSDRYSSGWSYSSRTDPGNFNNLLDLHTRLGKAEQEQDLDELTKIRLEHKSVRDAVLRIIAEHAQEEEKRKRLSRLRKKPNPDPRDPEALIRWSEKRRGGKK